MSSNSLSQLHKEIIACDLCGRLRKHCLKIAKDKRRAYQGETYWGKPIPGFGDPKARLHIIGLAPAAHGANRTGRIFTGDRSGVWLYRALYRAGFANQAESIHREDGLKLKNAYISCVARCAPPDNKPLPAELERCAPFLERELDALKDVRIFLALGQIALNGIWPLLAQRAVSSSSGAPLPKKPRFSHGGKTELTPGKWLLLSYHPSQQNTFTGRLTEPMFDSVFSEASRLIQSGS